MKILKSASGKQTVKLSKSDWEAIGDKAGWMKKLAMPAWVGETTQSDLKEGNWLIDLLADRVPPDVGIKALRKIDPEVALNLPKIYSLNDNNVKEIDGRLYIITNIEKPKKTKPSYVTMIDVETGDEISKLLEEVMPKLEQAAVPITESIAAKLNEEVRKHNSRLEAIDDATSNLTLLPLQLGRMVPLIDERLETLDAIIEATQAKLDAPKPEAMGDWETGMQDALLTGDLDEVTFVDTVLHDYKYRYDELVRDLQPTTDDNGQVTAPPKIGIPMNISNPDALRQKLISMGDLAFQEYNTKLERKKERAQVPGVPFDIRGLEFGPLEELSPEDIPVSHKSTGYRSYDAYLTSLQQTILSSQKNKDLLLNLRASIEELGQKLGALKPGQRANDYLQNTPEGQAIVDDLTNFINDKLGSFVTQYKNEIVNGDKIDTKKLGRKGSVGNAFLVIAFARLYNSISKILDNVNLIGEVVTKDRGISEVVDMTDEASNAPTQDFGEGIAEEGPATLAKSKTQSKIERMSELLWIPFEDRMRLK